MGAKVVRLERKTGGWVASTAREEFRADFLINCAGLQCDLVARLAGEQREMQIVPFLGVHFTRMIEGGMEAGPNAVFAFARRLSINES